MTWLQEYKQSLKNLHAEEPLDIYFFRPLAFLVVKSFYSLPITPNLYSLAALFSGIAAGYNFVQGTSLSFKWGAFYFLLFSIFDCCDGMVARLKKNGSEFGRLVDGIVDYVVNFIVYATLAIGLKNQFSPDYSAIYLRPWVLVIVAGISKALHSIYYDHYLSEYIAYEKGDGGFVIQEIEDLKRRIEESEKSNASIFRRIGLKIYWYYSNLQAGSQERSLSFEPRLYCEKNLKALRMWSFIGPAVHILVFIIACILNEPYLLFFYAVIFGNLWLMMMFIYQLRIRQQLSEGKIV